MNKTMKKKDYVYFLCTLWQKQYGHNMSEKSQQNAEFCNLSKHDNFKTFFYTQTTEQKYTKLIFF